MGKLPLDKFVPSVVAGLSAPPTQPGHTTFAATPGGVGRQALPDAEKAFRHVRLAGLVGDHLLGGRGQGEAAVTLDQQAMASEALDGFGELDGGGHGSLEEVGGSDDLRQLGRPPLGGEGGGEQEEGIEIGNGVHRVAFSWRWRGAR